MLNKIILIVLALILFSSIAIASSPKDSEYDNYGNTCKAEGKCTFTRKEVLPGNIPVSVEIVSRGAYKTNVDKVFEYIFSEVRRVAALLDEDNPSSEVSKVNDNAGVGFVEVGPELTTLIKAAKKANLWTGGAFDITLTPEIGNFKQIKISDNLVYLKKKGMRIGFKKIVSGYIADLLIRGIYNANLNDALVEVGQASRSIGAGVAGNFRTQVDDSEGTYAKRGITLDTSNVSVGSSIRGVNAPTFDPRWARQETFVPLARSVTIISRNAAISEALAHGIYILGPEKGMEIIRTLQNIRGVIVNNNGNFLKSPGL